MKRISLLPTESNFEPIVSLAALAGAMCGLVLLSGCSSSVSVMRPVHRLYRESIEKKAPIGKELDAAVGDRLFVKGAWFKYPVMKINQGVSGNITKGYGLVRGSQIKFNIFKTTLQLEFETEKHRYFCSPVGRASCETDSEFLKPLLGDARIGVLQSRETATLEWFVRVQELEVFSQPVKQEDGSVPEKAWEEVFEPDRDGEWVILYYGGYVDGKVHFELEENKGPDANIRREFKFNLNEDESPTRIGMKDFVLEILKVDNVRLYYRWVSIQ